MSAIQGASKVANSVDVQSPPSTDNQVANRVNNWMKAGYIFLALGLIAALIATGGLSHIIIHASISIATSNIILGVAGSSIFLGSALLLKGLYDRKYKIPDCDPKEFGLSGIKNTSNNCWLNSLMQILLNREVLKKGLENQNRYFKKFIDEYDRAVKGDQNPDSQPLRIFLSRICSDITTDAQFQDADEPLGAILQILQRGNPNLKNSVNTTSHFRYASGRLEQTQERESDNGFIRLPISRNVGYSIPKLLAEYFYSKQNADAHIIEKVKKTIQEPCLWGLWNRNRTVIDKVVAEKRKLILEERKYAFAPNDLFISLKRYNINPKVDVPLNMSMDAKYFETNQAANYELDGFTCHVDEIHYISYVKKNGIWFVCNDNVVQQVSQATASDVAKKAYIVHYKKL